MSLRPARPSPGSVFWPFTRELVKFVRELAINPRAPDLLNGHQADRLGWCSHPGHTPPERHPCSTLLWTAAVWMPETGLTSCDLLIFVEETAEPVVPSDSGDVMRAVFWECT